MDNSEAIYNLAKILGCDARKDESMKKHTTFKIGGNAETYIKVPTLSKLSAILRECKDSNVDFLFWNLLVESPEQSAAPYL